MRKLIYVPIIHTDPDLGRLAEGIIEQTKEVVGAKNWQKHKRIVNHYWQEIGKFWENEEVSGFKIFQDGMLANGVVGRRIVKELADQGSVNYKIVEQLMKKGGEVVKTEDPDLLKEEYLLTRELIKRKSFLGGLFAYLRYKRRKDKLLAERDAYIIKRINECLQEGETGICFLGAYHQLLPNLPKDITVVTLKNPEKVREYYQKFPTQKWTWEVTQLGHYLTKPIEKPKEVYLGKKI